MRSSMLKYSWLLLLILPSFMNAAIRGVVISRDGAPVANATVSARSHSARPEMFLRLGGQALPETLASTKTDAKGSFSLDVKGRNLSLRFEAPGYAPLFLKADEKEDLGAVALRRAEPVTLTVSAGGKPLANATVLAGTDESYTTNAEGKTELPDPRERLSEVRIFHPQYAPHVASLRQRKSLTFPLESGVVIEGKVTAPDRSSEIPGADIFVDGWPLGKSGEDGIFRITNAPKNWRELVAIRGSDIGGLTRNAKNTRLNVILRKGESVSGTVRDAADAAVVNARVQLSQEREMFPNAVVTDAKGNYFLSPLLPGSYSMAVFAANHLNAQTSIDVRGPTRRDFALVKTATIAGRVLDENRKAVAGASLSVSNDEGREVMIMRMRTQGGLTPPAAISAPDGKFVLRNVAPDAKYQVVANRKGFPRGTSEPVEVRPGELVSGISVTIPSGIVVRGSVRDSNDRPLSDVVVNSTPGRGDGQFGAVNIFFAGTPGPDVDRLRTGRDGTFEVRLREGTYDFSFSREGFASKSIPGVKVSSSSSDPINVVLSPGVEVSGRVIRGGAGVADVNVVPISPLGAPRDAVVTAPDGSFTVTELSEGPVTLMISRFQEGIRDERRVTAPSRDIVIELPAGGRVSGRVIDKSTRMPVTSFRAGMSNDRSGGGMVMRMPPSLQQFRSDSGEFVLENVSPAASELIVEAPGYVRRRVGGIAVDEGRPVSDLEVEVESGTSISGRVVSTEGSPLAGAIVHLATNDSGPLGMPRDASSSATTDGAGEFTLAAVESGEQTVVFQKPGYQAERKSVRVSGKEMRVDARLTKGRDVAGIVVTDGGVPVAGANVSARTAVQDAVPRSATTDQNGEFRFTGLTPGRYRFTASKNGMSNGEVTDFDIEAGTPLRIVIEGGGVITGRITGLTEAELLSARVTFSNGPRNASTVPDASGRFRLENAPTGTVRIRAEVGGMTGFRNSPSKAVDVPTGGEVNVEIAFDSGATVSGRVTRDRKPITNASISFMPAGGRADSAASTRTDDRGEYSLSGLTDGTYLVRVLDLERFVSHTETRDVRGNSTFDIDIRSGGLRGRVVDASTNAPIADVSISIREITDRDSGPYGGRTVSSDASGSFRLDSLSSGRYELRAQKSGYGQQTIESTIQEGSAGEVEFKLQPNDGIAIRIVDARDNRVLSGYVSATDAQGRNAFGGPTRADAAGVFRIPLSAGSYKIRVTVQNYAPRTVTLTSPSPAAVTVGLTPGGTLLLRNEGDPVRVRISSTSGESPSSAPTSELRIDRGVRSLENIPAGSWVIHLIDDSGASRKQIPVTVVEGQTTSVDLK